ncbi:hypothetical protein F385_3245 [Pantoea agglomerans 299R]|nr:hypothetical protein F385_3245 [Pantoea agglomerans 299R]
MNRAVKTAMVKQGNILLLTRVDSDSETVTKTRFNLQMDK